MSDKAVETMNDDDTIVEEVRMSDFNASNEDPGVILRGRDGDAPTGDHGFYLGPER